MQGVEVLEGLREPDQLVAALFLQLQHVGDGMERFEEAVRKSTMVSHDDCLPSPVLADRGGCHDRVVYHEAAH